MKEIQFLVVVLCGGIVAIGTGCGQERGVSDEPAKMPSESAPVMSGAAPANEPAQAMPDDAVLVTVNGKPLTRQTADQIARQMAARQGVPPAMVDQFLQQVGGQMEHQVVEQFIDQTLLEKEAERLEIPVTDEEVDAVLAKLGENLPANMTLEQAVASQGMTMEQLRKDVASNERLRKLYESKTELDKAISDSQVQAFYDENPQHFEKGETIDARHILIECKDTDDAETQEEAHKKAEAIRQKLVDGADFAELARTESEGPSATNGGSLGTFGRGQMVKEFEDAAFSLDVDEISPVVKTPFGYHIIQVTGKQEESVVPFSEASEDIRNHLTTQAQADLLATYLNELREQAEIEYPDSASSNSPQLGP